MAKDLTQIEPQIDGLAAIVIIRNKIDSLLKLSEAVQMICKRTEDSKLSEWIIRLHDFSKKEELNELTSLCDLVENYLRERHEFTNNLQVELALIRKDASLLNSMSMEMEFESQTISKPEPMTDEQWSRKPLQSNEPPF